MSRRQRARATRDKRAIALDLARSDPRTTRTEREPDELVTITGERINLRAPWTLPTTTKGLK